MAINALSFQSTQPSGSSRSTQTLLDLVVEDVHPVDDNHVQVAFVRHPTIYGINLNDPEMHDSVEVLRANVGRHVAVSVDWKTVEIKSVRAA